MHLTREFLRAAFVITVLAGLVVWWIVHSIRNAEEPRRMMIKWAITLPLVGLAFFSVRLIGFMGPVLILLCAIMLSYLWTPHIGATLVKPLTSIFDGGDLPPEPRPFYSIALAKQKQGRYAEAVAEVRRQLDRFPTDFEGQMLLAQMLAEDLKDIPGAELTIERLCAQPGHPPKNIAFALYSLADWQLKFSQDREAARRALQRIAELFPDTEYALGAAQRIAHLGNAEVLLSPHERKKFAVREGARNVGLLAARGQPIPTDIDPGQLTALYVKHLEEHPLDMEAREKLAILYADHYQRLDLASSELEQMIAQPHQPTKSIVHWLNLLADLQIRSGVSYEIVSQTLQRIIDRYPNIAAAEMARSRLARLKLELKAQQKSEGVKLGTYEQNIGLKRKPSAQR